MTFDKPVPTRIMANKVQERRWIGHFLAKCPTSHPPNESTALHPYERLAGPPSGAFPFWGSAPGTNGQNASGPQSSRRHGGGTPAGGPPGAPRRAPSQSTIWSTIRESWRRLRHSSTTSQWPTYLSMTLSPKPQALGLSGFNHTTFLALLWMSRRHQSLASL